MHRFERPDPKTARFASCFTDPTASARYKANTATSFSSRVSPSGLKSST